MAAATQHWMLVGPGQKLGTDMWFVMAEHAVVVMQVPAAPLAVQGPKLIPPSALVMLLPALLATPARRIN
jgi:hypothetical protein